MATITGGNHRDGRVRDASKSPTPVAPIVVPGAGPGDTVDWARARRKRVV
jgi:hypothetical protein